MIYNLKDQRKFLQKFSNSRVPVVHAQNPSYSGGRDQEDHGLKPALANSENLSLKNPSQK
jgi:pSer/pThr/pTyr-binding forkhead associated (FHA) protein